MPDIYAVIPCAGTGSRAGTAIPKQYQPIAGKAMLWHTLAAFAACPAITETLLVLAPDDNWFASHQAPPEVPARRFMTTPAGGASRAGSVRNGLQALARQGILARLFDDPASLRLGLPGTEADWTRLEAALSRVVDEVKP